MLEFDWNLLKRFKLVVDSGSIKNASNVLNLSQASLYNMFTELERIFKKEIIKKYNKGKIEPTNFGYELLNIAKEHNKRLITINSDIIKPRNELSIAALPFIATSLLAFNVKILLRELKLDKIYFRTHFFNPADALSLSDLFIFEDMETSTGIGRTKLGQMIYKIYASKESHNEILTMIKNNQQIKIAGFDKDEYTLCGIDNFIREEIYKLSKTFPTILVNTDSSIMEAMTCANSTTVSCLYSGSPLIKILNLAPISDKDYTIPIFVYYKLNKKAELKESIEVLSQIFNHQKESLTY